jgi:hypothetical protein
VSGVTYRGLGVTEWIGVWQERFAFWRCIVRGGHQWGPWSFDVDPVEFPGSPATRMCEHCAAYEERR